LAAKRSVDVALWGRHSQYLQHFSSDPKNKAICQRMNIPDRIQQAAERMKFFQTEEYLNRISGTLGVDPTLVFHKRVLLT
jgi:hypothetical protein